MLSVAKIAMETPSLHGENSNHYVNSSLIPPEIRKKCSILIHGEKLTYANYINNINYKDYLF